MLKPLFIICILCVAAFSIKAQSPKQWEKHGDASYAEGDMFGAAIYYENATKADGWKDLKYMIKLGQAYVGYHEYEQGEKLFEKIIRKDEGESYPLALYYAAQMEEMQGKYTEALTHYKGYLRRERDRSNPTYRIADQRIESCMWAIQHMDTNKTVEVTLLDTAINTTDSEFNPWPWEAGGLSYTSLKFAAIDPFKALPKKAKKDPIQLFKYDSLPNGDTLFNLIPSESEYRQLNTGNYHFDSLEQRAYFSVCTSLCSIYTAEVSSNGTLTNIAAMGPMINEPLTTNTQPAIAYIGGSKFLIFASNRRGSRGGLDLWISEFNTRMGQFARPRNAGRLINTAGDEITPYYNAIDQSLYFSSNFHNGYGGFDIFQSKMVSSRSPQTPINLGIPFNSPSNDMYFVSRDSAGLAYFTSNRVGGYSVKGQTCCNDIYRVEAKVEKTEEPEDSIPLVVTVPPDTIEPPIKPLKDTVVKVPLPKPLALAAPATLFFDNDHPNPKSWSHTTKSNYENLLASYTGYAVDSNRTSNDSLQKEFSDTLQLGFKQLNEMLLRIKTHIEDSQRVIISLSGFASPLAQSGYNQRLSERRIQSIENYISNYDEGFFRAYIGSSSNALVQFVRTPLGEQQAPEKVYDRLDDLNRSVYSYEAAIQRRVQVSYIVEKP